MFSIVTIPRRLKSAPVLWPLAASEEAAIPHVTCECVILAEPRFSASLKRARKQTGHHSILGDREKVNGTFREFIVPGPDSGVYTQVSFMIK